MKIEITIVDQSTPAEKRLVYDVNMPAQQITKLQADCALFLINELQAAMDRYKADRKMASTITRDSLIVFPINPKPHQS